MGWRRGGYKSGFRVWGWNDLGIWIFALFLEIISFVVFFGFLLGVRH